LFCLLNSSFYHLPLTFASRLAIPYLNLFWHPRQELGQLSEGMFASRSQHYNLDLSIETKKIAHRVDKLPESAQWYRCH
jgi:hypothetical protein